MKKTIQKASERGHTKIGWLDSFHSFSFGNYYDPKKMNFGTLRVLNDDIVAAGKGFGNHPHDNMEIISIVLEGELAHKDSSGGEAVLEVGQIQVMSAGSGVVHSEYNHSKTKPSSFLQIWIEPKKKNIEPRHETLSYKLEKNKLRLLVSPERKEGVVPIHQDAYLYLGEFEKNKEIGYTLHSKDNGVYLFLIDGKIKIDDSILERRDALEIQKTASIPIKTLEKSTILLMEIPLA